MLPSREAARGHCGRTSRPRAYRSSLGGQALFYAAQDKSTIEQRRCAGPRNTGARTKRSCGSETSALERRVDTVRLEFVAASHDKSLPTGTLHGTLKFAYEIVVSAISGAQEIPHKSTGRYFLPKALPGMRWRVEGRTSFTALEYSIPVSATRIHPWTGHCSCSSGYKPW